MEARYRAPLDTQLQAQIANWQETERQRLAADLHDSIGSSLYTIRLKLQETMAQLRGEATPSPAALLAEIHADLCRAMDEVRRIALDLRPSILDDLGIAATIGWLGRELEGSQKGIQIERHVDVGEGDVPASLKTAIFRIVQEALNNTVKHAGARLARVTLSRDAGQMRLGIEDDGRGFEMSKVLEGLDFTQHFGIANMRQRANSSGGVLTIRSAPGGGTVVSCAWPLTGA